MSYKSLDEDKKWKVVIIGDSNIGKTCLLERYINDKFLENPKLTIGAQITKTKEIITIRAKPGSKEDPGQHVERQFEFWDLGGHKLFEQVRTSYLQGADGILLCFSLNDHRSISGKDLYDADIHSIDRSLKEISIALKEQVREVPILLVGTKSDLERKIDEKQIDKEVANLRKEGLNILSYEIIDNQVKAYGKYYEEYNRPWETDKWRTGVGRIFTSSKTGENVLQTFEIMKRALYDLSTLTIAGRVYKIPEKKTDQKDGKMDVESPDRKKGRDLDRVW
ncbi:MAG: Rab family GTPase [Candidatus Hodarchaeales archaeon]